MSETEENNEEYSSNAPSTVADGDLLEEAGLSANDSDNGNMKINNVGTPVPSSPTLSLPEEDGSKNAALNDDNEDEEEYETSYAKLQRLRRKYGAPVKNSNGNDVDEAHATPSEDTRDEDNSNDNGTDDESTASSSREPKNRQRRRRRGGYGSSNNNNNAASVLETLNGSNDNEGASNVVYMRAGDSSADGIAAEDNNTGTDDWNLDNLDIVEEGEKSNLFLDDDEDDDATQPYDDRNGGDLVDDSVANDDGLNEEEDTSPVGRGRNRQKQPNEEKEGTGTSDGVHEEQSQPPSDEIANEGTSNVTTATVANPTDSQIIALVDKLVEAADINNMTVGGVLNYVAGHFGYENKKALGKEKKKMIKEHLTLLISGKKTSDNADYAKASKKKSLTKKQRKKLVEEGDVDFSGDEDPDDDDEDVGGNDSSSDYEEEAMSKNKKSKKARKKKYKSEEADDSDYSDDSLTRKRSKRRSKGSSKKGKMKQHLRDEAAKRRRRQLEEARIREEEMGNLADDHKADDAKMVKSEEEKASAGPQISEEDKQRAIAIAARFDTNKEELRMKREEDRVGLIGKLRQRRLDCFTTIDVETSGSMENKDEETGTEVVSHNNRMQERNGNDGMIELDDDESDSEGSDDDSDDDGPEITAIMPVEPRVLEHATMTKLQSKTSLDSLLSNTTKNAVRRPIVAQKSKSVASNPRMALRMALREKQVKAGNRWLARELGYKTEEDHIRDCRDVENKKRKQIFLLEKEVAMREEKTLSLGNEGDAEDDSDGNKNEHDDENDEMAIARELNQIETADNDESAMEGHISDEQNFSPVTGSNTSALESASTENESNAKIDIKEQVKSNSDEGTFESITDTKNGPVSESLTDAQTSSNDVKNAEVGFQEDLEVNNSSPDQDASTTEISESMKFVDEDTNVSNNPEESTLSPRDETAGPKKPRNSAWQAMLKKEKDDLAKQKRRQRKGGALVEGEAEEEEEEEGIVGLEDFGFAVQKKKGDDDEDVDDADVDDDDLEHVVDDVSDGEGDEEAGEAARKRLEAKEEKERHKEIMRRMREGYGGRDRGIASGIGGARGMHRFDVLVGADNRDEAKQLGLLNDDELDSDDEGEGKTTKKDDDEEEDEAALLDKMLKERFLQKQDDDILEENFSDDDEEVEDDNSGDNKDGEDDEDKEQDRLAKRFAKRARMNRILEAYEGDSQFSRSRLIDEDESTQNDLKAIKTSLSRKRGIVLIGDKGKDNSSKENNLNDFSKRQKGPQSSRDQNNVHSESRFLMNESSLSIALVANRNAGKKRKTSFINGKHNNSFGRKNSACSSKSLSLGHVVFMSGESQTLSSNSFMKSIKTTSTTKKSSKQASRGSSLWSKVCSKNLR